MTRIFLACTAGLAAGTVRAEDRDSTAATSLKQLSLEELMEVEIKAPTKAELPIREAPMVGSVVTRKEIDAYGWTTLGEVLLRQPGYAPAQDFERVTISGRGQYESWNNNHLRLLIDGVPVNSPSNGIAYVWEMLPLFMVESIEIIRSQGSALYGSNAINGVVAINTRKAGDMPPAEMRMRAGTAGTNWQDAAGSASFPWISLVAGYGHRGTLGNVHDSYDASGRTTPEGALRKFEVNDARSTQTGFLKFEGDGPLTGLSLQAHYSWWKFQTGHGWLFNISDVGERSASSEGLTWITYAPPPMAEDRLRLEFVAEWLHHGIDYRIRQVPDSVTFAGMDFPDGITEVSELEVESFFVRAQADYRTVADIRGLAGIENTFQPSYSEGKHQSNVDLNRGGNFQPFPDGALHDLRPINEAFIDQPFNNIGVFLQAESGDALSRFVKATAGVRYDMLSFDFIDLDQAGQPVRHRTLEQVSPRAALVVLPHPDFSLKALAERAFRSPASSELFARNTLLGNSDPNRLEAEEITVYTLAGDLTLFRDLTIRADGFLQDFENQIAFSGTENLTSNLYSRQVAGIETELLAAYAFAKNRTLSGYLNYTWVTQLDEDILLPDLAPSDRLTWAPGQYGNIGVAGRIAGWEASAQGHFQGRAFRRDSDRFQADGTPTAFSAFRNASVDPWFTLDALVGYRFTNGLRLWAQGRNLLDEEGFLMKPGDYPFDYRIEGVQVQAAAEISL